MTRHAPTVGWGILLGAAVAASFGGLVVQLLFAAMAMGVVGMAHGASDLAIVKRQRRPSFLLLYILVSAVCLLWWTMYPGVALPLFLAASALHFGLEDAPSDHPIERVLRGASLIATPATLHQAQLVRLLGLAGGMSELMPAFAAWLTVFGALAATALLIIGASRSDVRLIVGTTVLLILPPLVGFSVGFLILHALPQTTTRSRQIGCADSLAYFKVISPILAVALVLLGLVGWALLRFDATGVRSLFAGIAALAMPHLMVTPWFEGGQTGQAIILPHSVSVGS